VEEEDLVVAEVDFLVEEEDFQEVDLIIDE